MHRPAIRDALLASTCAIFIGCGAGGREELDCADLLPADQSGFEALARLVTIPGAKGCSNCHNTQTPLYGYNFEGPGVAYDALASKIDLIYPQVASGLMPKGGTEWDDADLRLLRSWYCYGATYEK